MTLVKNHTTTMIYAFRTYKDRQRYNAQQKHVVPTTHYKPHATPIEEETQRFDSKMMKKFIPTPIEAYNYDGNATIAMKILSYEEQSKIFPFLRVRFQNVFYLLMLE